MSNSIVCHNCPILFSKGIRYNQNSFGEWACPLVQFKFHLSYVIGPHIMAWVIEPWMMALVVQVVVLSLNHYELFRVDSWS
jgi:hypothetical protein